MPGSELLLERLKEFCASIEKKDKILIIHHNDTDGLCSALIVAKAIKKIAGKKPEIVIAYDYSGKESNERLVKRIRKIGPDRIIVLDFSIDYTPELAKELEDSCKKMAIIDHHKVVKDLNSEKTVFIKAAHFGTIQPSLYANAKLVFDIANRCTDMKKYAWLACVGIIGDKAQVVWKEFIEKTEKESGLRIADMEKTAEMISAVETLDRKKFGKLFEEFFEAESPEQIMKSGFFKYLGKFETKLRKWEKKFEKEHKEKKELDLVYYTINPKENLKSALINAVCDRYPSKTVIIFQQVDGKQLSISARRKDFKVKMNDLLENAVKNIPDARAGGHVPAAGGSIPKKYYSEFMQRIEKELEKQVNKA